MGSEDRDASLKYIGVESIGLHTEPRIAGVARSSDPLYLDPLWAAWNGGLQRSALRRRRPRQRALPRGCG
eukprot:9175304-Pyramimonas_sp.AAC.1